MGKDGARGEQGEQEGEVGLTRGRLHTYERGLDIFFGKTHRPFTVQESFSYSLNGKLSCGFSNAHLSLV